MYFNNTQDNICIPNLCCSRPSNTENVRNSFEISWSLLSPSSANSVFNYEIDLGIEYVTILKRKD